VIPFYALYYLIWITLLISYNSWINYIKYPPSTYWLGRVELRPLLLRPFLAYSTSPRWWWMMSVEQSVEWLAGKTKVLGKTCPSDTLSTTNPTWPNLGCHGGKPVTNCLSYGTATSLTQFWLAECFISYLSVLLGAFKVYISNRVISCRSMDNWRTEPVNACSCYGLEEEDSILAVSGILRK
jgi:hypothetical protein